MLFVNTQNKMNMITSIVASSLFLLLSSCSKQDTPGGSIPQPVVVKPIDKEWTFETTPSWSDEFDYSGAPNTDKWGYDIGGDGWGNNELQYYTNSINNA